MSLLDDFVKDLVKENKLRASLQSNFSEGLMPMENLSAGAKAEALSNLYGSSPGKPPQGLSQGKYNLGSQEFADFLDIPKVELNPSLKIYDRFSPTTNASDIENEISKAIGEGNWGPSTEYFEKLKQQGVTVDDLKALTKYQNFPANWKEGGSIEKINRLTKIAQQNPNPIYAFSTREGPLYRGALANEIPEVGQEFSFGGDRFKSFSPDLISAWDFIKGRAPAWKDSENMIPVDSKDIKTPTGRNTLFQIVEEPTDKYNYLITPGPQESEVLGRPDARYEVLDKTTFNDFESRLMPKPLDIDVVRLRQTYSLDPFGAAIEGGKNLFKQNPTGPLVGASVSLLNPDVAKAVERDRYGEAANIVAKDVASGAAVEAAVRGVTPMAGKLAPTLVRAIAPAARLAGPVATGLALFNQGRTGSLTDIATRKAVTVIPGLKSNPKTDIGRRAGNEFQYMFNQLRQGRIPYKR